MYDVIVVGARCAGSPTAMLLARRGYRVLLVDKVTLPSDVIGAPYIHQPGVACLERWGLLPRVTATACPPIQRFSVDLGAGLRVTADFTTSTMNIGGFHVSTLASPSDGARVAYAPRRTVLDRILVDAAVEAGAELREGFLVQDLLMEDGQVRGIRGRTQLGSAVDEQARIVIGADGLHSAVARYVQAPSYRATPSLTFAYHAYWTGMDCNGLEFYPRAGRAIFALPTNDGLTSIGISCRTEDFHRFRADVESNFLKTISLVPDLAARVRGGYREGRILGTAHLPNYFRQASGRGWALVGDAGYHRDPITGQGMTDAFRDAEMIARAIDHGLSGKKRLEQTLADYEEDRNAAVSAMYRVTLELAALRAPSPDMIPLIGMFGRQQLDAPPTGFSFPAGRPAVFGSQRILGP
jgi:2-polyprenyl-6-methoxyphenol hydroxylase-like FAD-dependent oxidoreductase